MTDAFEEHRNLLFAVAYRMLGRAADAEDAVQDAWLRWSSADRSDVSDPRAYLVRITTNVALDRLRSAQGAPRDLRRPVAARADADLPGRRRGGRAVRVGVDWRCSSSWRP